MRNPFELTAYIAALAALAQGTNRREGRPLQPVGGHRHPRYRKTDADIQRLTAAQLKRERKGAKLQRDYDRCLANNPCRAAA